MADYKIIDLREELARVEYRPPTEAELYHLMITGLISPALYEIRAARLDKLERNSNDNADSGTR